MRHSLLCLFLQAEERLKLLEKQRQLEEEKQNLEKTYKKTEKAAQEIILNKKNSRPKLAFGLKPVLK